MGWLDLAVLIVLAFYAFTGYRRGLVGQLFGLAGIIIALVMAFTFFGQVGSILNAVLPIGSELCNILGFVLIVAAVNGLFALIASRWRAATKSTTLSLIDSVAGAVFGGVKALLTMVVIVVILVSLPIPALRQTIEDAPVASRILQTAPLFYLLQERSLPPNVPRLLITSQGVQLKRINFADLDGAMCISCRHKVKYDGFRRKGLISYPHFTCTNPKCGLASDCCLTFQGYHRIYGQCPLRKADRGEIIGCAVWPNPAIVTPKGPCPVCGAK